MNDPRLTEITELNDPRLTEITDLMRLMAETFVLRARGAETGERRDREVMARWEAFKAATMMPGAIGALDLEIARQPSLVDLGALFGDTAVDLNGAVARLEELGLSDLIEPRPEQALGDALDQALDHALQVLNIEPRVAAALGVKACSAQGWDPGENEAFFLASFARLYAGTRRNPSVDPDSAFFGAALDLGRLLEWWRLRRLGLDQYAAERKRAMRAFKDIGEHSLRLVNQQRRGDAAQRNTAIRALAAESTLKGTQRDRHVKDALALAGFERPSTRTIRRALQERD